MLPAGHSWHLPPDVSHFKAQSNTEQFWSNRYEVRTTNTPSKQSEQICGAGFGGHAQTNQRTPLAALIRGHGADTDMNILFAMDTDADMDMK